MDSGTLILVFQLSRVDERGFAGKNLRSGFALFSWLLFLLLLSTIAFQYVESSKE